MSKTGRQRPRARAPRHLGLGRLSAVDGAAVAACGTDILVPAWAPSRSQRPQDECRPHGTDL